MKAHTSKKELARILWLGVSIFFAVHSGLIHAQTTNGVILGTISDPSGAVVSGATVTVKSARTGAQQSATTDSNGGYNIPNLQVGHYAIAVSRPGFKTAVLPSVELQVAQEAKIDTVLQVSEQVEVTADASPLLNAITSSVGQVIDTKTIASTPLDNLDITNRRADASVDATFPGPMIDDKLITRTSEVSFARARR